MNEEFSEEEFLKEMEIEKAIHRANGCKVFDEMIAKCTCPKEMDDVG